jgi:hypothetical protein
MKLCMKHAALTLGYATSLTRRPQRSTTAWSTLQSDALRAPLARRLRNRSLQGRYHSAFTGAFVLVESAVGAFQKFLWRFTRSIVGPAARILQAHLLIVEFEFEAFQARQHVPNFFGATFRKQGHELITTQTHREIGTANGALQAIGKAFQDGIACGVAVAIINLFKAVEIHKQNGERAAVALRATDFLGQALFAGATVVKTGELIESRELVNLRSESFYLGQRLHLIRDLVTEATELDLLVDQIDAKHQNESDQSAHRLIQVERVGGFFATEQRRESERRDGEREQQNYCNSGGPQPPLAAIEMMQMFADLLRLKVRYGLTIRLRLGLSVNIRHGSSLE